MEITQECRVLDGFFEPAIEFIVEFIDPFISEPFELIELFLGVSLRDVLHFYPADHVSFDQLTGEARKLLLQMLRGLVEGQRFFIGPKKQASSSIELHVLQALPDLL